MRGNKLSSFCISVIWPFVLVIYRISGWLASDDSLFGIQVRLSLSHLQRKGYL